MDFIFDYLTLVYRCSVIKFEGMKSQGLLFGFVFSFIFLSAAWAGRDGENPTQSNAKKARLSKREKKRALQPEQESSEPSAKLARKEEHTACSGSPLDLARVNDLKKLILGYLPVEDLKHYRAVSRKSRDEVRNLVRGHHDWSVEGPTCDLRSDPKKLRDLLTQSTALWDAKSISLQNREIDTVGLAQVFRTFPKVEKLNLLGIFLEKGMIDQLIAHLPTLTSLRVTVDTQSIEDFMRLSKEQIAASALEELVVDLLFDYQSRDRIAYNLARGGNLAEKIAQFPKVHSISWDRGGFSDEVFVVDDYKIIHREVQVFADLIRTSKLRKFRISSYLTSAEIKLLAAAIKENTSLEHLEIKNNFEDPHAFGEGGEATQAFGALIDALAGKVNLTHFGLSSTDQTIIDDIADHFVAVLPTLPNLKVLSLGDDLEAYEIAALARAFVKNKSKIEYLSLSYNLVGHSGGDEPNRVGVVELGKWMETSPHLKFLYLDNTGMLEEEAKHIQEKALQSPSLTYLSMREEDSSFTRQIELKKISGNKLTLDLREREGHLRLWDL